MSVVAIDLGSSAIKAGLFSEAGECLAIVSAPSAREDAPSWLSLAYSLLRQLGLRAGRDRVRRLSVSGNGPSLVCCDRQARLLRPVLDWADRRAVDEAAQLSALVGHRIDPSFYLPKAMWLLRHGGKDMAEALFLPCPEYLAFCLCGIAAVVLPEPGYAPYIWNEDILSRLGLPALAFPPLVVPGISLGPLSPEAAGLSGLGTECQVVSGLPDFLAALIGSACLEPGLVLDRSGSSEALNLCADAPSPDARLLSLAQPQTGLFNVSGGLSSSGSALAWVDSLWPAGPGSQAFAAWKDPAIAAVAPGSDGLTFLPYLEGERAPLWRPELRAAFVGLSPRHGQVHMRRAALESIAFALKHVLSLLSLGPTPAREIRISGGLAENDLLNRIKADVLGLPCVIPEIIEAELLGGACLCLAELNGTGFAPLAKELFRPKARFEPRPGADQEYREAYAAFLGWRDAACDLGVAAKGGWA